MKRKKCRFVLWMTCVMAALFCCMSGTLAYDEASYSGKLVPYYESWNVSCTGSSEFSTLSGLMTRDGKKVTPAIYKRIRRIKDSYGFPAWECYSWVEHGDIKLALYAEDNSWAHHFDRVEDYFFDSEGLLHIDCNCNGKDEFLAYQVGNKLTSITSDVMKPYNDKYYKDNSSWDVKTHLLSYVDRGKGACTELPSNIIKSGFQGGKNPTGMHNIYYSGLIYGEDKQGEQYLFDLDGAELLSGERLDCIQDGGNGAVYYTSLNNGTLSIYDENCKYLTELEGELVVEAWDGVVYSSVFWGYPEDSKALASHCDISYRKDINLFLAVE